MFDSSVLLMLIMAPVVAYMAGIVLFNGVRVLVHRLSLALPNSRRALPSG